MGLFRVSVRESEMERDGERYGERERELVSVGLFRVSFWTKKKKKKNAEEEKKRFWTVSNFNSK